MRWRLLAARDFGGLGALSGNASRLKFAGILEEILPAKRHFCCHGSSLPISPEWKQRNLIGAVRRPACLDIEK
jgi:hypothetical protein